MILRAEGRGFTAFVIPVLLTLLCAAVLVSLSIGRYPIPITAILGRIFGSPFPVPAMEAVFFNVRLPRIALACVVGCSLSAAGVSYQGVFQNPLASPDILGASGGAAAGAAAAILLRLPPFMITLFAFCASLITIAVVLPLGNRARGRVTGLILAGMMVSAVWNAAVSFMKLMADPNNVLPEITYWLMGSLAKAKPGDLGFALPLAALGILPLLALRWRINLLTLRDEEAQSMGIPAHRLRSLVILASTLLTAQAVSAGGVIGWVGLIVPHSARRLFGNDYRLLMPASMLTGALFLLLVDNVSRNLFTTEIPLGILTSLLGAPFFLWLLGRNGDLW